MELALEWLESQRAVMYDANLQHYFLQYNYSSGGNGTVFNAGRAEGDQFFWNYLQNDAAQYYISSVVASLADNATDGTLCVPPAAWHRSGPSPSPFICSSAPSNNAAPTTLMASPVRLFFLLSFSSQPPFL